MTTAMTTTETAIPRWANVAAHLAAASAVPSGLWRIAMGLQIPVGFTEAGLREFSIPGWGTVYVFGLSLLAEALAFLTFGLVRRWGEVMPRWVPVLGDRRIPPLAAIVPAMAGAVAVTLITWWSALNWGKAGDAMPSGTMEEGDPYQLVMTLCYAPLLLWGPLLVMVTLHYWRRRGTF
ncbi:hypothetical protein [Amycolatopsis cihanbeyliensis]|uniref:Uncharacterized protein n=1 Tax=Amycolatopsis cihanbeyliensis TaxID=1128664 RepID=A0A542DHH3_AMYCI|nr:hypothetical protein [Amycolatopsis cihanbeyliensis]TQJ02533.1 hypothetical protein FB471_2264 [Amycolatopsis cihanbeyliensis]